eukprot:gene34239-biopygen21979
MMEQLTHLNAEEAKENQDKAPISTQEIEQRVYETHNTMMGVFTLLAQRYSMLQLRASLDGDTAAHGGPEALKAKLAFMEEKLYNNSDGFTNEPIFNQWLQEFETSRQRAVMNRTAKQAARGVEMQNGRLTKQNDWCFSFDLKDDYHCVGIDPDFQKYMQFDVQGELYQCSALPLGWNGLPRIFVKFMK